MAYFALEAIRMLIRFQWKRVKPKIMKWLFLPFFLHLMGFSIYAVYNFEVMRDYRVLIDANNKAYTAKGKPIPMKL